MVFARNEKLILWELYMHMDFTVASLLHSLNDTLITVSRKLMESLIQIS